MSSIKTFLNLLEKYKVEIPRIQRDYVQGSNDEFVNIVRDKLLDDMYNALYGNTTLDLNFVYGKEVNGKFIPLDGQQRLTTLFLLHIFAYSQNNEKTELLKKFTYETRLSSKNFVEKLVENRKDIFLSDLKPSSEIKDSNWFLSTWKFDPTISAVLNMLDDIKEKFKNKSDLSEKLEEDKIIFHFNNIDEIGMEDDLYIKLNSRGRPLSDFENFKAQLFDRLNNVDFEFKNEFKSFLDIEWTNVVWKEAKVEFDRVFMNFFENLFACANLIEPFANTNWYVKLDYSRINSEIYYMIYYCFNYICSSLCNKEIKNLIFKPMLDKNKGTLSDKVMFYAVILYIYKSKALDLTGDFNGWIRILKNLISNSIIDDRNLFKNAINAVNSLSEYWENITEHIAGNDRIAFFNGKQIDEERIKAKIIIENEDFGERIKKAEENKYFNGQIRSALYLSKKDNGEYDEDIFNTYWKKITSLFDDDKPKFEEHLLRRALLTFGDYLMNISNCKTFCVDNPNDASQYISMRNLFSDNTDTDIGKVLKDFLEEIDTGKDIKTQLEDFIKNSSLQEGDWRYCFVKYPRIFEKMNKNRLRIRKAKCDKEKLNQWIIIPSTYGNGYNYDVYLETLRVILEDDYGFIAENGGELGTLSERYLLIKYENKEYKIKFEIDKFVIYDKDKNIYVSSDAIPITDICNKLECEFGFKRKGQ
ncbi:MAG: DUF262 domain-containing protein [Lachnospirales bacterium]